MSHSVRLGDHTVKIGSGQTPSGGHNSYCGHGIPLIRSQNVLMGSFSTTGLVYISPQIDQDMAGSRVLPGDVLLNITGASIGRVCIVPDKYCPANVNQHVCIIRCKETLDPDYVAALLASPKFQDLIWGSQAGGTRQALTKQMIEGFVLPWCPIEQQRQIATRLKAQLAEVETARKAAEAQADDIALLRTRALKDALAALDRMPLKVLGDHAPTTSGTTPSRGNQAYWLPAEIPWVKTGEVAFAPVTQTSEAVSRKALDECSLMLLPPKTVLVAMYGQGKTRGQSAILEVHATTNQACFAILPNDTWTPEFLYHWLMVNYQNLRSLSQGRGGNQANLNGAMLKSLEVPAPGLTEQKEWVKRIQAVLREVDAMKKANQTTLEELAALPQRLLAQAFNHREAT